MSEYYSNAETGGRRSTVESNRLVRYLNSPQSDRGSSTTFVFAPKHYHRLDEAATWAEFDSRIRSVGYHLGNYVEHKGCNKDSKGVVPEYGQEATVYSQQSESLVRYGDGNMSSNAWRHKVESDMAISGLVALKNILDLLYENGKHMIGIAGSLTMWSILMSASYLVRSLHYSPYLDNGAFMTFCAAGYYTASSTYQLFHVGLRTLAINRCHCIVTSLHNRVLAGTIEQPNVESLHSYWFRALSWYKVEDRLGRRQYGTSYGCYVERSLPSSEYVIPLDD
ncbi:hypothetical protein TsFJ059_001907 [Trichoderma semiorbis]|uniref:Uncharacterized protein n=1 Tax=Trichoderma semiorbis TaxID=1491008 RepID=A0A9P8HXW8_9HYPO|nr:hypothetical protein TsFJ059_001907 [Trichoderma semiorbis]